MQIGGYGGAPGAAREENEENAAPQALPGARTRATPQCCVLLCYVLPCPVMFCSMLWGPKMQSGTEGAGGKVGKPAPKAPGELIIRRRRRRGNAKSAPKAPGEFWILPSKPGGIWANPGAQAEKAGAQARNVRDPGHCGPAPPPRKSNCSRPLQAWRVHVAAERYSSSSSKCTIVVTQPFEVALSALIRQQLLAFQGGEFLATRVSGAEWRKRMSAHKAAIRKIHCAPGPVKAVRTQKVVIWPPKNGIHARWHPIKVGYGTLVAPPEIPFLPTVLALGAAREVRRAARTAPVPGARAAAAGASPGTGADLTSWGHAGYRYFLWLGRRGRGAGMARAWRGLVR
eukprot:gene1405-biopygen18305